MLTIVGAGHKPRGLGNTWEPRAWMPAVEVLRARIAEAAALGAVRVVSDLEPGYGLMLAAAALLARDEGLPVELVAAVLCYTAEDDWGADVWAKRAAAWYRRILARGDVGIHLEIDRAPTCKLHWDQARGMRRAWMLGQADTAWVCWDERPRSKSDVAPFVRAARGRGIETLNVYGEIAEALGLRRGLVRQELAV